MCESPKEEIKECQEFFDNTAGKSPKKEIKE